ncbi:MAG: zf-TFIIB domain-containing protein [Rhodocyclales bacterium]|nr:zf-TFIIB domain-containing protein [Rhodocyclales bacterium]
MKCPVCIETTLVMTERQGIEIDYCPQCRGVWLDRGELDKIIERSQHDPAYAASQQGGAPQPQQPQQRRHGCDDEQAWGHSSNSGKRGGFFKDLFD